MEDQPVEVVGQIGHDDLRLGPRNGDGADEQAEPVLLMCEYMLYLVALGMGLPAGLRR